LRSQEDGLNVHRNGSSQRRRADLAIPVKALGGFYHPSVAGKLLSRFDDRLEMVLFVESHWARLAWMKCLMDDIFIVWIDAPECIRERRCLARDGFLREVSDHYKAACLLTRERADLVLNSAFYDPEVLCEQLVTALSAEKNKSV
jgi:dephospho-CoA kinase